MKQKGKIEDSAVCSKCREVGVTTVASIKRVGIRLYSFTILDTVPLTLPYTTGSFAISTIACYFLRTKKWKWF